MGAESLQEASGASDEGVNVIRTLPRVTGGRSLVSEIVNVTVPGLMFRLLTVKLTFPFESVAAV